MPWIEKVMQHRLLDARGYKYLEQFYHALINICNEKSANIPPCTMLCNILPTGCFDIVDVF
jgi:hypothetical protein